MTKSQLIDEILNIKSVDTRSNLMKKTLAELNDLLDDLLVEDNASNDETEEDVQQETPSIDIDDLKEQMKREMMEEMKEKIRKEIEEEMKSEVKSEKRSTIDQMDRYEMIPVMNITNGSLIYTSRKTGAEWNWTEYGDIEYMEFGELLTMRSAHRRFFDEPFILVMDDRSVEHLGLTKMYEKMKSPDKIDEVFNLSQADFQDVVEKSPKGIKHLIITRAKSLYDLGEFDSARKIKYLNEKYQADIGLRG